MSCVSVKVVVMVGEEECEFDCDVEYGYAPGHPETPPAYSHGGLPPEPPDADIISIKRKSDGLEFEFNDLSERMQEKIIDACIEHAEELHRDAVMGAEFD